MAAAAVPAPKRWGTRISGACGASGYGVRAGSEQRTCDLCGEPGHLRRQCPQASARQEGRAAIEYVHTVQRVMRSPGAPIEAIGRAAQLSVLITTSPVPSNPATEMIEAVIANLSRVEHLAACPLVIVCDGYNAATSSTWKAGKVDAEGARAYDEYLLNLEGLVKAGSPRLGQAPVTLVLLEGRHGQALAVKAGLDYVRTELVLVHQHDILFMLPFDLGAVCDVLRDGDRSGVHYVGFPLLTNVNYEHRTLQRHGVKVMPIEMHPQAEVTTEAEGCTGIEATSQTATTDAGGNSRCKSGKPLHLMPIIFWYDSTHITSVRHYQEVVFSGSNKFRRGDFIEETFGVKQRLEIMERGLEVAHGRFGTYHLIAHALDGSRIPVICHMGGNRYLTLEQRAAKWGCDPTKSSLAHTHPKRVIGRRQDLKVKDILKCILAFADAAKADGIQEIRQCLAGQFNKARERM